MNREISLHFYEMMPEWHKNIPMSKTPQSVIVFGLQGNKETSIIGFLFAFHLTPMNFIFHLTFLCRISMIPLCLRRFFPKETPNTHYFEPM